MARLEFLRPSGAATWVKCSGYVAMRAAYPESPEEANNDVREDGVAAHWLANEIWHKRVPTVDSLSPNNRVMDEAMFDAVDEYLSVLQSWGSLVKLEDQLDCSVIYPGMKGTPDAYEYDARRRLLRIADLKYGFRFVEVWENWQMICYAWAIIQALYLDDQQLVIEFVIVQPRSNHRDGPVRTWRVHATDLRAHLNILKHAAHMALGSEWPECTPNPGCGDCAGRHACTALHNSALAAVETSYGGVPLELPAPAVGQELRLLKAAQDRIEARINGLEVQAELLLKKGTPVPHWQLATTYARETWREGTESQVLTLGTYYNANLAKPAKAITPAQARKLIPSEVVAMFAHKPSTGVKLAKQDPYEARKKFQTQPE